MSSNMVDAIKSMGVKPKGVKPTFYFDKRRIGLKRIVRLIARVYSEVYDSLIYVDESNIEDMTNMIVGSEKFMKKFALRNGISDPDVVAIREAVRWAAYYIATGRKKNIKLVLVEPRDAMPSTRPVSKTAGIWNSFVLSDYSSEIYTEYRTVYGAKYVGVKILSKSIDNYEVLMGGPDDVD